MIPETAPAPPHTRSTERDQFTEHIESTCVVAALLRSRCIMPFSLDFSPSLPSPFFSLPCSSARARARFLSFSSPPLSLSPSLPYPPSTNDATTSCVQITNDGRPNQEGEPGCHFLQPPPHTQSRTHSLSFSFQYKSTRSYQINKAARKHIAILLKQQEGLEPKSTSPCASRDSGGKIRARRCMQLDLNSKRM